MDHELWYSRIFQTRERFQALPKDKIDIFLDVTAEFAQLRATVDQISFEHVQTRFHIEKLKAALFTKISSLETTFLTRSDNQDMALLVQTEVLRKEMQAQKAMLSQELDVLGG
ncbi:putative protein phosphatase 2C 51 [Dorcoceras hygrometricum]|uniref:Uncharacterized protein n=1 Tax=Dorcoceras hygrometricum TaxID=472368 RepID=A0A2Z7CCW9_9LAMI|nr:putative protein phosphatase 2C 51 [Dorcoceras hygrometricum]